MTGSLEQTCGESRRELYSPELNLGRFHGLDGVGFELVVFVEGGVEADALDGLEGGDGLDGLLGQFVVEADDERALGDGIGRLVRNADFLDLGGEWETCFEEEFVEDIFGRGLGVKVVDVHFQLLLKRLGVGLVALPQLEIGFAQFEDFEAEDLLGFA